MPTDAAAPIVRVVIATRAIVAQGARERPPVGAGDWDAQGYARERARLWHEALAAPLAERGIGLQIVADLDDPGDPGAGGPHTTPGHPLCLGGDTVALTVAVSASADANANGQALRDSIAEAARSVIADSGGWRRFLQPGWFERHRAWRREVGSPIQH